MKLFGLVQLPSAAFGDGSHPTTRQCARAIDYLCRTRKPEAMLDVGTGTGILARIGRAQGVPFVVGTDIDPTALAAARANVALDQHIVEIELSNEMPHSWGPRFDLVVANILEAPLRALSQSLRLALAPGGVLLLSGFMPPQAPALRALFPSCESSESTLDGWSLLMLTVNREAADPRRGCADY